MNSSKTWRSGERCRDSGRYNCQSCQLEGRRTVVELQEGAVVPLCSVCAEKDATWSFIGTVVGRAAGS